MRAHTMSYVTFFDRRSTSPSSRSEDQTTSVRRAYVHGCPTSGWPAGPALPSCRGLVVVVACPHTQGAHLVGQLDIFHFISLLFPNDNGPCASAEKAFQPFITTYLRPRLGRTLPRCCTDCCYTRAHAEFACQLATSRWTRSYLCSCIFTSQEPEPRRLFQPVFM